MTLASIPKLTLEIVGKGRAPERRTVDSPRTIVGRESGDIVLHDVETSALHAEIDCSQGHVIVRDLGSRNGTWREGKRLPQFALYEGQSFFCGTTEIKLVAIEGTEDRPKPGQTAVGRTDEVVESSSTIAPGEGSSATMVRGSGGARPAPAEPIVAPSVRTIVGTPLARESGPIHVVAPPGWRPIAPPPEPPPNRDHEVPALGVPAPLSSITDTGDQTAPPLRAAATASPASPPSSTSTLPGKNADAPEPAEVDPAAPGATLPGAAIAAFHTAPAPIPHSIPAYGDPAPPAAAAAAPPADAAPPRPLFRGPVANAVIKDDKAAGRAAGREQGRRVGRALAIVGLVLVGIGAVAGIAYLVYTLVAGRAFAFTEQLASELPQDTVALYALESPKRALALFGDDVPADVRARAVERLKFDPFDVEAWEGLGIDPDAPVGVALLSIEQPIVAVSVGVEDRDKLQTAMKTTLATLIPPPAGADAAITPELRWVERAFGDVPGLWLEDPMPAAALFRDDRMTVVFPIDGPIEREGIERHAKAIAELHEGTTLADRPGFSGLPRPQGEVLSVLYVDGASLRAAIPGADLDMMSLRMLLGDVDGFMAALSHKGSDIHVTYAAIMREGSRQLELLEGEARKPDAIDRIPSPVLAELDVAFSADAFDRALGGAASYAGASLTFWETELREGLGIDLRADFTQNLSGRLGLALLRLPSAPDKNDFGVVGFVGVKDEAAAKSAAERVYAKAHDKLGLSLQQIEGVTVYELADKNPEEQYRDPTFRVFVHAGHVFFTVGEVDVRPIIVGPDKPFRNDARHDAIADAMRKGGHGAGFVDIVSLVAAIKPLLDEDDRAELESMAPIVSLLEAATMRADVEGRAVVVRSTLHTTADEGLPTLVQATTKLFGAKLAEQLARAARQKRCAALAEHVVALTRTALSDAGADLDTSWDIERKVLEECGGPKMTDARLDCYLASKSIEGLVECDKNNPAGSDEGGGEAGEGGEEGGEDGGAEPRPVPYVDDIWPHLTDDPDSAKPQPEVNYGVPLGPNPQQRGPDDALVTIVEFGEFQCPYCKRVAPTLDQVLADHGKDVRIVFRHHPLENLHADARNAAKAAIAAGKQGKFWEMHDRLFAQQHELNEANFRTWAGQIGIDLAQFDRDYYDAETDRQLQADIDEALKFGADGTPAFFINGRYIGGAQTKAAFDSLIAEEKARALTFVERRGNTRKRLYEDMISHFAPEVIKPTTPLTPVDPEDKRYIISTIGLPQKGATGLARVQVVECGDFDCPYCARSRATIDKVLAAYPSQVSFFFAHHPLEFHHGAEPAARAAVAADNQGKFWEMHDLLFDGQGSSTRTEADFVGYARTLKLDVEKFKADFAAAETAEKVESQRKVCADNEVTATPTFFVNGARVEGAEEFDRFKALIDAELAGGI